MKQTREQVRQAQAASRNRWKLVLALTVLVAGILLAWSFGVFERLEDVQRLKAWFAGFGVLAPIVFVGVWILASTFFLPGLPITIVGAFVFGPIFGSIYTLIGATLGATAAFVVGRYAARGMVADLVERSDVLRRIDQGVEKHGWRMLMIARLVPLFPFNAQNYAFGATRISLWTYVGLSFVFMIPGVVAYNFAAGKVLAGEFDATTLVYLAIAAVLFVLLSLIPKALKRWIGADELIES